MVKQLKAPECHIWKHNWVLMQQRSPIRVTMQTERKKTHKNRTYHLRTMKRGQEIIEYQQYWMKLSIRLCLSGFRETKPIWSSEMERKRVNQMKRLTSKWNCIFVLRARTIIKVDYVATIKRFWRMYCHNRATSFYIGFKCEKKKQL